MMGDGITDGRSRGFGLRASARGTGEALSLNLTLADVETARLPPVFPFLLLTTISSHVLLSVNYGEPTKIDP